MNTWEMEIWSWAQDSRHPPGNRASTDADIWFPQATSLPRRNKGTKAPGPETQCKYLHPGHNESSQRGSIEVWGHWEKEALGKSGEQTPAQEGEGRGEAGEAGLSLLASPGEVLLDAVKTALGAVTANVGEVEGEDPSL